MLDPVGVGVLVVVLLAATAVGAWRRRTDGRLRPAAAEAGPPREPAEAPGSALPTVADPLRDVVGQPGERGTFVQFSSAFCAPCRTARTVLADLAGRTPGVRHVEVDAEEHLDLVRRLGITRTPTTLVLDSGGREVGRASGVPRRDQLVAVLASLDASRSRPT